MLATLTDEPFSREGWLFEPKLDGERCLVFRNETKLELYSRNQKLLNTKYPELVEAEEKMPSIYHRWRNRDVRRSHYEFLKAPTAHADSTSVSRIA